MTGEVKEMNIKQLQYAVELAKVCNFSKVSEQLNISQPALSKQIITLEKELNVKLFDRNSTPLRLTAAGEHFVREAQDLLYKEDQLKRSMEQFSSGECGRLNIGVSPFRSIYLLPTMAKKVRDRFPEVEICISDTNSEQNRKDVAEGRLDFAIVNLPVDESVLDYIPIEPDILVLAVPNELLKKLPGPLKGQLPEISFKDCINLPFIVADPSKEMRILFERFCATDGVRPKIATEVVGLTTAWAMARAGIGATLLPLQFLRDEAFHSEKITLLKIKNDTYRRQPVIVTRRGQYLPEYAKYAIELLQKEYSPNSSLL